MLDMKTIFIRTIVSTILYIIFCYLHFLRYRKPKEIVIGLVWTVVTSFSVFYGIARTLSVVISDLMIKANPGIGNIALSSAAMVLFTILYIGFISLFCATVGKRGKYNRIIPVGYSFFVYTQYLIINYLALIFSMHDWAVPIVQVILLVLWFIIFKNELPTMNYIYPKNRLSPINLCIVMEYIFVLFFWTSPLMIQAIIAPEHMLVFELVLSVLAGLFFIFSILIQKLMFQEAYHEYREIQSISSDELTGLTSRTFFLTKAQDFLKNEEERFDHPMAVIFYNLVEFKYYNELHGKADSDQLLVQIAKILLETYGSTSGISRLSDDHFAVFTTRHDTIEKDIEQVHKYISQRFPGATIKAGIYPVTSEDTDIHQIIDNAKIACDCIKLHSGVIYKFFDAENARTLKLKHYVINNIDRAVQEQMLTVYYQPILDVATGTITGHEALIRWFDDNFGFLAPDEFIQTLEEQNLTYKIDCFVIEQVCKDLRTLRRIGKAPMTVAVNLSRKDFFTDFDIVELINDTTARYEIEHQYLNIEITESAFTEDNNHIRDKVKELRSCGYKVWMDDFGSGYSSLNMLGSLEFDGIKLDMVFLRNMNTSTRFIIQSIVNSTKALGLSVLMEGVETEEHYSFLQEIGCDNAQGFLFGKPAPMDEQ